MFAGNAALAGDIFNPDHLINIAVYVFLRLFD